MVINFLKIPHAGCTIVSMTRDQIIRYSRQLLLPEVRKEGQEKLLSARVLVVGAGGLGSPAIYYLAAAGVGTIGIADRDTVELSNLNRQILYSMEDLKKDKAHSAAARIAAFDPDIRVHPYSGLDEGGVVDAARGYDIVLDCTDSFESKFGLNDICVGLKKPFVHAGVIRTRGQVMTWIPGSACYRCVFREPPEKGAIKPCVEAGVLGVITGIIGSIQAAEAIKHILGKGSLLTDRMLTFDTMTMESRTISVSRHTGCVACGGW